QKNRKACKKGMDRQKSPRGSFFIRIGCRPFRAGLQQRYPRRAFESRGLHPESVESRFLMLA
ncbi:MAG: hypothetical protein ACOC98_13600, partial [Thermodesulfobacteriota bacterium]